MTGVNIDKMIEFAEATEEAGNQSTPQTRRLSKTEPTTSGRRIRR